MDNGNASNRYMHLVTTCKRPLPHPSAAELPPGGGGGQNNSIRPPPDVVKSGFFDRTFPSRKSLSSGRKIGDLYHLSRHSYTDLDQCQEIGNNIPISTSGLKVHFASGDVFNLESDEMKGSLQLENEVKDNYGWSHGARTGHTLWIVDSSIPARNQTLNKLI